MSGEYRCDHPDPCGCYAQGYADGKERAHWEVRPQRRPRHPRCRLRLRCLCVGRPGPGDLAGEYGDVRASGGPRPLPGLPGLGQGAGRPQAPGRGVAEREEIGKARLSPPERGWTDAGPAQRPATSRAYSPSRCGRPVRQRGRGRGCLARVFLTFGSPPCSAIESLGVSRDSAGPVGVSGCRIAGWGSSRRGRIPIRCRRPRRA